MPERARWQEAFTMAEPTERGLGEEAYGRLQVLWEEIDGILATKRSCSTGWRGRT